MTFANGVIGSLSWIELALVMFFAIFVIIVIGVVIRRRGHFDAAAHIPLDDDVTAARPSKGGQR